MNPVAVIGAGITGLTAAFCLHKKGVPVTVYEAGNRVGGAIQSLRAEGYLAEFGPNTILETSPRIGELIRDAGLASKRLDPDPSASARYVVRYRRPVRMPSSPIGMRHRTCTPQKPSCRLTAPMRLDEQRQSPNRAEFVLRRLGQEVLDHAIHPHTPGVYAGDPHRLSVQQAFPKLGELEAKYGSLIKGQILGARERKQRGEIAKDRAPKFSFDEGLQVLPDTLKSRLGDAVRLRATVESAKQTEEGWELQVISHERGRNTEAHSAIIYAGTAFSLAKLRVNARAPIDLTPMSQVRYPPVASVVLGFRREDVQHPCSGFGMLIPRVEGFKILAQLLFLAFSESRPGRAPGPDELRWRRAVP